MCLSNMCVVREKTPKRYAPGGGRCTCSGMMSSSSLLLSSLELSDTKVSEPSKRARLGTAARFCEVVVLKLGTVPVRMLTRKPPPSSRAERQRTLEGKLGGSVGQHILLDVQGAVLALVVRQSNTNLWSLLCLANYP